MIGTRLLERYELTAVLGRGGMGVVYRAHDPLLDRQVAVKMVPPKRLTEESRQRFEHEARTVAGMDHPSIVPIYDFGAHQESIFFVMPLIDGGTLRSRLRGGQLTLGETLEIIAQAADALDYSHSRGVIHGDVKPENLMLSKDLTFPRARLMDFGLARRGVRVAGAGPVGGTIVYMSPEQILGTDVDRRSDLYSLGVVLYECLAGEPPFVGTMASVGYRVAHQSPASLRQRGIEVDGELERIVQTCLAKEPAERLRSCGDLASALRAYVSGLDSGDRLAAAMPAVEAAPYTVARSPLVGRREEWRRLVERLDAAQAGECQLVLIGGDAGTGKSRLLEELESTCQGRGLRVLRGRITDHRHALPYQGLGEMILDELRSRQSRPTPSDLGVLAADLVRYFPAFEEVDELRSAARQRKDVVTWSRAAERPDPVDVFELFARTLSSLAGGEPMVLMLEHLNAGDRSVEALDYLVRRLAATPTLIAGTYRRSELERGHPLTRLLDSTRDDRQVESIQLGPFDRQEIRAWLEWLIGSTELADELVEQVFEASEGNPFFCQELARALIESGRIHRNESGIWSLTGAATRRSRLAASTLPVTIQQAVTGRIEHLPPPERHLLNLASVLGRSFEVSDLEDLLQASGGLANNTSNLTEISTADLSRPTSELAEVERANLDLDDILDTLIRRRLLEEDLRPRGDRLRFASGVIRDVIYHGVSRRRRRRLHRHHAEALEQRFAHQIARVRPQLVEHFFAAEIADKTAHYGLELAREALASSSPQEAIATVQTALELIDDGPIDEREEIRGELLTIAARAYRNDGDLERALDLAATALDTLTEIEADARAADVALLAAETAWQGRQGDVAERWVEVGAELARRAGVVQIQKRLLTLGATVANLRGAYARAKAYLGVVERLTPPEEAEDLLPQGGVLVTVLANPVASYDPAVIQTAEEFEVAACIFDTLLTTDEQGAVVPGLCAGARRSGGGVTFELELYSHVQFSDGSPVTAQDVKTSFERAAKAPNAVPALTALVGFEDFASGRSEGLSGLKVLDDRRFLFQLAEPLPIFPALLTNLKTAIVRRAAEGRLLGTGPFEARDRADRSVGLRRNANDWRPAPARLDGISFRTDVDGLDIAAGLRRREIDLGRDLLPQDLEWILRDPELGRGLVEATKKNVYFLLFNSASPVGRRLRLRQALTGALRPRDLIWRTLGRFAQPAVGLIPPGIFGHDPGRRRSSMSLEHCQRLLGDEAIRLRLALHPLFQGRYLSLWQGMLETWQDLGVEVEAGPLTMESFVSRLEAPGDADALLMRWIADYDDPDNFTYELFHSRHGVLRHYFSSPEADRLLEQGRRDSRSERRQELYHRFEDLMLREALLLPLFHDVDYRIAAPGIQGLSLKNTPPYVRYSRIGKRSLEPRSPLSPKVVATRRRSRAVADRDIHVPIATRLETLDPAMGMVADQHEVTSCIFETLTRIDPGARAVPHLASAYAVTEGGLRWRFSLRPEVRFHDGRRLTTRDVRYSFERLLRTPRQELHFPLMAVKGAKALRQGLTSRLTGLQVLSATEFELELTEPVALLPALLSHPGAAILPEGGDGPEEESGGWQRSFDDPTKPIGTGPFRVVSFSRRDLLMLERNPQYWRAGYPKTERLIFHFGIAADQLGYQLRSGRLSLVNGLAPRDAEALRRDPKYASGFHQVPRLATYFLVPVPRGGPLADLGLRRTVARLLDPSSAIRAQPGRWVTPAFSMIPPGLLGHEPRPAQFSKSGITETVPDILLRVAGIPVFAGPFAHLWDQLGFASGLRMQWVEEDAMSVLKQGGAGEIDLLALRWIANTPDTDGFIGTLLHSEVGLLRDICSSLEVDQLIDHGRRETDPGLRHEIYRELEELIAREVLLIPLFHEPTYRFCDPGVEGLDFGLTVPELRYEQLYHRGQPD